MILNFASRVCDRCHRSNCLVLSARRGLTPPNSVQAVAERTAKNVWRLVSAAFSVRNLTVQLDRDWSHTLGELIAQLAVMRTERKEPELRAWHREVHRPEPAHFYSELQLFEVTKVVAAARVTHSTPINSDGSLARRKTSISDDIILDKASHPATMTTIANPQRLVTKPEDIGVNYRAVRAQNCLALTLCLCPCSLIPAFT